MKTSQEKQKRMAYIARRYYLEDQKQSDIARELGISRPLVSRILSEARELGVVEITIHDPEAETAGLLERLRQTGAIQGGILVEDGEDNDATNQLLSKGAVELLQQLGTRRLGVGWGYLIGQETRLERAAQGLHAGIGRTDADDAGAPFQGFHRNLNGKILFRLDHRTRLIVIVHQHPPAGVLLLEQIPIPDQGCEVGA